jgi:hypothetical protein
MTPKPKKKTDWEKRYNAEFSKKIRERGYCEFHNIISQKGLHSPCKCNDVLQCCHKISRSKKIIKYDTRNVFCGCSGSNTWSHWNQIQWNELWKQMFPEDIEYLEEKSKQKYVKRNDWTWKIMLDELRTQ